MSRQVYPWKRFWCPREGKISLADSGFLLDPESEYAKYHESDVVSFDAISDMPCLVLLGEPGIGKSTAIKAEFERARNGALARGDLALWFDLKDYASDERLERIVFDCEAVRDWLGSGNTLHLFFDSLDEGLLRVDNISRVLLSRLEKLPAEKLRLRIASRPLDWQVTLERGFVSLWGDSGVRVFELAPLRRVDVALAAELSGVGDPGKLIETAVLRDVVPLAIKPVTLEFLIGIYAKGGTLPTSRAELYFQGCRRLCEEPNRDRRDSLKGRERLTVDQRLAIAARIAAVTQLSNHSAIWLGMEDAIELEDVLMASLVGGTEPTPGGNADVSLAAVREVLDTGLFSSRGAERLGWRHQTYAEYLAAYYLNVHNVTLEKLRSLILHGDGSGKVVPQLWETVAWLSGMSARAFQLVAGADPEVLLQGDMATASSGDRANLARRILESLDSGKVTQSLWQIRKDFARLASPELADIVQPYLSDSSRHKETRVAAIEMARLCRLTGLQGALSAVALSPGEATEIRKHAASAVVEVGDAAARRALRPLAFGQAGDDPRNDLRGYGLMANWPGQIDAQDLFSALVPVKDGDAHGEYARFLRSGLAAQLESGDMAPAVAWARHHAIGRDELDAVHNLASEVLQAAVAHIDQAAVLAILATALLERMRVFTDCSGITAKLCAAGDDARRAVAREMFSAAATTPHGPYIVMDVCAIGPRDVSWLLSELSDARDEGVRSLIAQLIFRGSDPEDVAAFDAVLIAARDVEPLRTAMGPLVVYLDTPLAEEMKSHHRLVLEHRQPKPTTPPPIAQQLSEALEDKDAEAFFRVHWLLGHQKKLITDHPADHLPGWSQLNEETRSRILGAARRYLTARPPVPPGAWWREGRLTSGMLAYCDALSLLATESPDSLSHVGDGNWEFRARLVLTCRTGGSSDSARVFLITQAYLTDRSTFLTVLADVIDGEDERHGRVFAVDHLGELWDEELATMVRRKVTSGSLKPDSFKDLLGKLLKMGDAEVRLFARGLATGTIAADGEGRRKAVLAAALLISHDPREWRALRPVLQANESFGVEVLEAVAYGYEYSPFATTLDEGEIAEICIWISRLGLDKEYEDLDHPARVTPRGSVARWWNSLINSLAYKGTVEACGAIRRLIEALPQYTEGFSRSLKEAEDRTRRATWKPLSPAEVIRLAAQSPGRFDPTLCCQSGYGEVDKRLVEIRDEARLVHAISDTELNDFLELLSCIGGVAGRSVQDNLFPRKLSEDEFQKEIKGLLRSYPQIGSELEEHPHAARGITDLSFRKIRIELKVEANRQIGIEDASGFLQQAAQYVAGSDRRLGVLCILDCSQKAQAPGSVANDLALKRVEAPSGDLPICIGVIIVRGNLPRPSSFS